MRREFPRRGRRRRGGFEDQVHRLGASAPCLRRHPTGRSPGTLGPLDLEFGGPTSPRLNPPTPPIRGAGFRHPDFGRSVPSPGHGAFAQILAALARQWTVGARMRSQLRTFHLMFLFHRVSTWAEACHIKGKRLAALHLLATIGHDRTLRTVICGLVPAFRVRLWPYKKMTQAAFWI